MQEMSWLTSVSVDLINTYVLQQNCTSYHQRFLLIRRCHYPPPLIGAKLNEHCHPSQGLPAAAYTNFSDTYQSKYPLHLRTHVKVSDFNMFVHVKR